MSGLDHFTIVLYTFSWVIHGSLKFVLSPFTSLCLYVLVNCALLVFSHCWELEDQEDFSRIVILLPADIKNLHASIYFNAVKNQSCPHL